MACKKFHFRTEFNIIRMQPVAMISFQELKAYFISDFLTVVQDLSRMAGDGRVVVGDRGRKASRMWLHFDAVKVGNRKFARCKVITCEAHKSPSHFCLMSDKSTKTLWRHLRSHHPEVAKEEDAIEASKKVETKKQIDADAARMSQFVFKPSHQLQVTDFTQKKGPMFPAAHPIQKKFERNMKNLLLNDALPFKLANSVWFKKMVHDLEPRIKIKSRVSYSRSVRKEGKIVKMRAREHVRRNVTLGYAASVDMWRSVAGEDYLGLNSQFVDSSWRWQKITTACKPFPGEHTAVNIKGLLEEEDRELGLPRGVVKVNVTDTASDIVAGRNIDGYSSFSCGIHKLMLVGDDAEKASSVMGEAVKAGAALVNHARHSNPFHRKLKKYCQRTGHTYTKLVTHCKTRWNSKNDMIQRLLYHRRCLQDMEYEDADPGMPAIEISQWKLLEQMKTITDPMKTVTKVWESETEPTMPKFGSELFNLKKKFEELIKKEEEHLSVEQVSNSPTLTFLKSLHFNLERRFPSLGLDTDLGAWGHLLNPSYKVGRGPKRREN